MNVNILSISTFVCIHILVHIHIWTWTHTHTYTYTWMSHMCSMIQGSSVKGATKVVESQKNYALVSCSWMPSSITADKNLPRSFSSSISISGSVWITQNVSAIHSEVANGICFSEPCTFVYPFSNTSILTYLILAGAVFLSQWFGSELDNSNFVRGKLKLKLKLIREGNRFKACRGSGK